MTDKRKRSLKKPALRVEQNARRPLYVLALTAEELFAVAGLSRLARGESGKLLGYQRPEVRRHVQDIVSYLNTEDVLLPNSLIVAFSTKVTFKPNPTEGDPDETVTPGVISIPIPKDGEEKPGWIVDGQQRSLALSQSKRASWPVPVNAFVADDLELQRDQFLRVNNTRPLPRGLITELLPEVVAPLPRSLSAKKLPSALCDLLNRDPTSPFYRLIRRASTPPGERRAAVVADASLVQMLEESLTNPSGCLFPYHNIATAETDLEGILSVLVAYWSAVRDTFPEAWGKPPGQSRLMHGTGIRAMGRLMDRMVSGLPARAPDLRERLADELNTIAPACRWTAGRWDELELDWREVQNVPRHLKLLSNLLVRSYLQARGAGV